VKAGGGGGDSVSLFRLSLSTVCRARIMRLYNISGSSVQYFIVHFYTITETIFGAEKLTSMRY